MKTSLIISVIAAASLAGCAGDFRVDQTEPIRIEIDDGRGDQPQESTERVVLTDSEPRREFIIENENRQSQSVQVQVRAEEDSEAPTEVIVIVRDADTDEEIERQTVVVQNTLVQNVDLNVEGDRNIIVVTEVVEGQAEVIVTADQAEDSRDTPEEAAQPTPQAIPQDPTADSELAEDSRDTSEEAAEPTPQATPQDADVDNESAEGEDNEDGPPFGVARGPPGDSEGRGPPDGRD